MFDGSKSLLLRRPEDLDMNNDRAYCRGASVWPQLCGALHLHTRFSDGEVDYPTLIGTADMLGLDFVGVTDHMTLEALGQDLEGFYGDLFVLVGYEHQDRDNKNHYLAFGVQDVVEGETPADYVAQIKNRGGVGFVAHPSEKRHYFSNLPPYPWTAWEVADFDGIEIWNQMSEWVEHLKTLLSFVRFMYPRRFLRGAPRDVLQRWDGINRQRFAAGMGGVDAHTRKVSLWPLRLTVFPLKVELKGIRTHVFLPEGTDFKSLDRHSARRLLLRALRGGHGYVSNYRWGDARGTVILLEDVRGRRLRPGERTGPCELPAIVHVRLPRRGEIRLLKNGEQLAASDSAEAAFPIDGPGAYRVEVHARGRAWIYSNPFPVGEYPL
jgi:hypothetical protein